MRLIYTDFSKLKRMNWTQNKTLLEYSKYTPCKDIFQAVCDEIGQHYAQFGFTYARSRPKITFKNKDIKLEIGFWSSGYNTPGDFVRLEIIPLFFDAQSKSKKPLFYHIGLFCQPLEIDNQEFVRILDIFDKPHEGNEPQWGEPLTIDSWRMNVYGIDGDKFKKLIGFIDTKIISWLDKLSTEKGVIELLEFMSKTEHGRGSLNKIEMENYVKTRFPNLEFDKIWS
jgi:hypothetical protein